ncbi:MFS transporter [Herbaspirillum lusitanum]|uniref:MFS transporter n=1 Tax=Herbaspirillum lusitanum TaxID=213312 RepID=UPI002AA2B642|nr:MFS transporter [Herbaspirillum lusitanum]
MTSSTCSNPDTPAPASARPHPANSTISQTAGKLPLAGLLALAMAAFITVLTEAMPAGLLPQMSADLGVSESLIGQLVTLYAIGSMITAIPLTATTQSWRRKPLLMTAIVGFVIVNTITAVSTSYALTLAARFFAGVFAGVVWALIAGYAARMAPSHLQGRAIAVTMAGIPIALSLGIPAATFLGASVGWRLSFGIMSAMTLILIVWTIARVPDFPGQKSDSRLSIAGVFMLPGVRSVLFVTLAFVLAHNILYTYIAPFLARAGMADKVGAILLIFGVSALASIWVTGALIDRRLRTLVLISIVLFGLAAATLGIWGSAPAMVYAGVAAWGLAYGGVPTLFQTASAKNAGDAADLAQAMIVTVWNLAIAGGGIVGGVLLDTVGVASFPWALLALLAPTLAVAWLARRKGFPAAAFL